MNTAMELVGKIKRKSTLLDQGGKVITLPPPSKKKEIKLSPEAMKRKVAMEQQEAELTAFIKKHTDKLKKIKASVDDNRIKYRDNLYKSLADVYKSYIDIEADVSSGDFYATLRGYLLDKDFRIQSNSTDVSLLIRYVFGPIKPKAVNDYGNALMEAQLESIKKGDFLTWIKKTTMSKASDQYKARSQKGESREALMSRARVVILRMLDVFETQPRGSFQMLARNAEGWVHSGSDVILLVARGVRRFDRGSDIADIRVCCFIPPSLSFELFIINRLAKHICDGVYHWEEQLGTIEDEVWAGDLYNYLSDKEAEAAEKDAQRWSERMAAAHDLDRGLA